MTVGKNKGLSKKGKNAKKVEKHAFLKKEWFKLFNAKTFDNPKPIGWIPGKAVDNQLGRVCEVTYQDLKSDSTQNWRKVRMQVEKVDNNCLYTSFHGLNCTRERVCSILKKRQTLIELYHDVKTSDGFVLRIFADLCTSRKQGQEKKNSYAKTSHIRTIRRKIGKYLSDYAERKTCDVFVNEILSDFLPNEITKRANSIFPIKITLITKVKVIKKPKQNLNKLMEGAKSAPTNAGTKDVGDAENQLTKELNQDKATA